MEAQKGGARIARPFCMDNEPCAAIRAGTKIATYGFIRGRAVVRFLSAP